MRMEIGKGIRTPAEGRRKKRELKKGGKKKIPFAEKGGNHRVNSQAVQGLPVVKNATRERGGEGLSSKNPPGRGKQIIYIKVNGEVKRHLHRKSQRKIPLSNGIRPNKGRKERRKGTGKSGMG